MKKQLNVTFRELSKSIINSTEDVNIQSVLDDHEKFHQTEEKRVVDLEIKVAKMASDVSGDANKEVPRSTRPRGIEIEKCKVPTFSGRTIDYPEFKKSWKKVVSVHWDDDNQMEQMKFKVDSHTKLILSRCKDMDAVWQALDDEYGQEQEVVNAVNHELRQLVLDECSTPQLIVNLRNALPGLEEALSAVDGLEHLKTPDKVCAAELCSASLSLVESWDERGYDNFSARLHIYIKTFNSEI